MEKYGIDSFSSADYNPIDRYENRSLHGAKKGKYSLHPTMPGNRPTKMPRTDRGISMLRNQVGVSPLHSDSTPQPTPPRSRVPSPDSSDSDEEDEDLEFFNHFDSLKPNYEALEDQSDEEEELDDMDELLELSTKDLTDSMVELLVEGDDGDLDWVPERLRKKAERERKARKRELTIRLQLDWPY